MRVGDTIRVVRKFTTEDVDVFTEVSHDRRGSPPSGTRCCQINVAVNQLIPLFFVAHRNVWHVKPDKEGKLMAQGATCFTIRQPAACSPRTQRRRRRRFVAAGLLTATMSTVVGGMIGFMARRFMCESP